MVGIKKPFFHFSLCGIFSLTFSLKTSLWHSLLNWQTEVLMLLSCCPPAIVLKALVIPHVNYQTSFCHLHSYLHSPIYAHSAAKITSIYLKFKSDYITHSLDYSLFNATLSGKWPLSADLFLITPCVTTDTLVTLGYYFPPYDTTPPLVCTPDYINTFLFTRRHWLSNSNCNLLISSFHDLLIGWQDVPF